MEEAGEYVVGTIDGESGRVGDDLHSERQPSPLDGPHPDPLPGGEGVPGALPEGEGVREVRAEEDGASKEPAMLAAAEPDGVETTQGGSEAAVEVQDLEAAGEMSAEGTQRAEPAKTAAEAEAAETEEERLRAEVEALRSERDALRLREVESHRRYLLAEHAGRVVPELVSGESVEALNASLEAARAAYDAVRQATLAELAAAQVVGASNGTRESAVDLEGMSPMQKIAFGLKRSQD